MQGAAAGGVSYTGRRTKQPQTPASTGPERRCCLPSSGPVCHLYPNVPVQAELIVLRLIHVLGGLFWVGSGLFNAIFLMPVLGSAGPAAGAVMAGLQKRRLMVVMPVVAVLTILSGLRLMWIVSAGFSPAYFATPMGGTFGAGGAAALVSFVLGLVVIRPAMVRAGRLGAELAAATDEQARAALAARVAGLRRRSAVANGVAMALLVLAAAAMAVARYTN